MEGQKHSLGQTRDRTREAQPHAIRAKRENEKDEERERGKERKNEKDKGKRKRERALEEPRKTRLRLFRGVRRERRMSDVSVHARTPRGRTDGGERERKRALRGEGEGRVVGCWAGCRKRSHHPVEPGGRVEKEGKDTAMCDVGRRRGRSGTDGEKEEEEGTAPLRWRGDEKERGVRRGELPATRSPSIPR